MNREPGPKCGGWYGALILFAMYCVAAPIIAVLLALT